MQKDLNNIQNKTTDEMLKTREKIAEVAEKTEEEKKELINEVEKRKE